MRDGLQLRFRLGRIWYGLPLREIFQIAPLQGVRKVPGTPSFIRGLMKFQGRLLTVLDPSRILGVEGLETVREEHVLVLTPPNQHLALSVPGMPSIARGGSCPGGGDNGLPEDLEVSSLIQICDRLLDRFLRESGSRSPAPGGGE